MIALDDWRRFYAEEIRVLANLRSPRLVEAFAHVPREKFLGAAPWQIISPDQLALLAVGLEEPPSTTTEDPRDLYHNVLVSLVPSRGLNNGLPSALARWLDSLELQNGDRVFHMGCGAGYYTAIVAEMVGARGGVLASEVDPELAARAKENLASYSNVLVAAGDGAALDPGLCDAVMINAGVTHPRRLWLDRLNPGGSILLPLTAAMNPTLGAGMMVKIVREAAGFSACPVSSVAIFSCTSLRDPQLEPVLKDALATKRLLKLRSVRIERHRQADSCIVHTGEACLSSTDPA